VAEENNTTPEVNNVEESNEDNSQTDTTLTDPVYNESTSELIDIGKCIDDLSTYWPDGLELDYNPDIWAILDPYSADVELIPELKYDENTTLKSIYNDENEGVYSYEFVPENNFLPGTSVQLIIRVEEEKGYTGTKTYDFKMRKADISKEYCRLEWDYRDGKWIVVLNGITGCDVKLVEGVDYVVSKPSKDEMQFRALEEDAAPRETYWLISGIGDYTGYVIKRAGSVCGESYTDYCDYIVYVDSVSLSLSGKIYLNIYLDFSEIDKENEDGSPSINMDNFLININGESNKFKSLIGECAEYDASRSMYKISCPISSKNMGDVFDISIDYYNESNPYDNNGKVKLMSSTYKNEEYNKDQYLYKNGTFSCSARYYLNRINESSDTSVMLKNLAYYMNLYGQYSQLYFGYNTDLISDVDSPGDLSYEQLDEYKKKIYQHLPEDQEVQENQEVPEGIHYVGTTLSLENEIAIRHYFTLDEGRDISDYEFSFDGFTPDGIEEVSSGRYAVMKRNISAKEIGQEYSLKVESKEDGDIYCEIRYSVLSYVYDVLLKKPDNDELVALCKSLYFYWKAAADYFEFTYDKNPNKGMPYNPLVTKAAYSDNLLDRTSYFLGIMNNSYWNDLWNHYKENNFNEWYEFQMGVLNQVPIYSYIQSEESGGRYTRIYNTDGTLDGVYIYRGKIDENGKRTGSDGEWFRLVKSENDTQTIYRAERYYGEWKNDLPDNPNDTSYYYVFDMYVDKSNNFHSYVSTEYTFGGDSLSKGLFNAKNIIIRVCEEEEGQDPSTISEHKYTDAIVFSNGYISNAEGCECGMHSGCSNKLDLHENEQYYKINGAYDDGDKKRGVLEVHMVSCDSNNYKFNGDNVFIRSITNKAYELVTSEKVDYAEWNKFIEWALEIDLKAGYPVTRLYNGIDNTGIAIYRGWGSDDIYVFYGQMMLKHGDLVISGGEVDGVLTPGAGKWMTAKSYSKTDDTGYRNEYRIYEVTDIIIQDNIPVGKFETALHTEIISAKHTYSVDKKISGSVIDGFYDGNIKWETIEQYADIDNNSTEMENSYSATFNKGVILADYVDSEGYSYVYDTENLNRPERILAGKLYGINGWFNANSIISESSVSNGLADASRKAQAGNEGNSLYELLYGSDDAKKYSDYIFSTAKELVGVCDAETLLDDDNGTEWKSKWASLKATARLAGITADKPLIALMSDGNFIGIYGDCDRNDTYYIYCGDMTDWKRSGNGKWISLVEYNLDSEGNGTENSLISYDEYEGTWRRDLPEGDFSEKIVINLRAKGEDTTIIRKYSGKVSNGAFDGVINWSVYNSSTDWTHSYMAEFNRGYIQGYNLDRDGNVYVAAIKGGYSEDKIQAKKRYCYRGVGFTNLVSGDEILYKNEVVVDNNIVTDKSFILTNQVRGMFETKNSEVLENVNSISKYTIDELFDIAYELITAETVDYNVWNDFCLSVLRHKDFIEANPLSVQYSDGVCLEIYLSGENSDEVNIYRGGMIGTERNGRGTVMSVETVAVRRNDDYNCIDYYSSIHKANATWMNDKPNGEFTDVYTTHMYNNYNSDYSKITKTYTGTASDGKYVGVVNWNVFGEYQEGSKIWATNHDHSTTFDNGRVSGCVADSEGLIYIPGTNSNRTSDILNASTTYGIAG